MNLMAISDKISPVQLSYAMRCIYDAQAIAIITHQNPDGDALGSSLAMRHWLLGMGKQDVTNIVPTSYPDFLAWMPGAECIVQAEQEPERAAAALRDADLVICTDLGEANRVASMSPILAQRFEAFFQSRVVADDSSADAPRGSLLVIDHHLSSLCTDAPEQIAYPDCASACELVFRLAYQSARQTEHNFLTPDFATCVYTGMMTDTGNFSYNSCQPEMYAVVAMLLTTGINKDAVYDRVFNAYSADRVRLMGYCLYHKMRLFPEYHTALITLNRHEIYRFNAKSGDMEGIVNLPLQIKDIYYSVFMREDKIPPHQKELAGDAKLKTKLSFRSQGDRPVNVLAREVFHGGGHMNASGGEYFGTADQAAQMFIENMPKYIQKG